MAEIAPFRGVLYDPARVRASNVLAPPYDVIDSEDRARLAALDPHNCVQLILPETGGVQLLTTVLKFVPLVLIGVIGLFFMDTGNFGEFAPNGYGTGTGLIGGITAAMALTLWAFIGLESATVPAEEVRDPARTIPRATIWGTLVTAAVYAGATIAVMGIVPLATLQDSTAPFADAATEVFGGAFWGRVVALVVMISTFGALNGWILLQGRVPYAAAKDGLFPKAFGKLGRNGTPVFGLVVSSVLITGLRP